MSNDVCPMCGGFGWVQRETLWWGRCVLCNASTCATEEIVSPFRVGDKVIRRSALTRGERVEVGEVEGTYSLAGKVRVKWESGRHTYVNARTLVPATPINLSRLEEVRVR